MIIINEKIIKNIEEDLEKAIYILWPIKGNSSKIDIALNYITNSKNIVKMLLIDKK